MADFSGRDGIAEAQDHAMNAQGPYRDGEKPVVTAARGIVRDHERDPVNGTIRTFGGRDEARLESAISRLDRNLVDVAEIGGILSADVAIQAMAATRIRHLEAGRSGPAVYDAKDLRSVRGDSTGIEAMGRVELGNVMTGNHDRIGSAASQWIQDTKSFVGRQAVSEGRLLGEGARMASVGSFARSPGSRLTQIEIDAYRNNGFVPRPSSRPGLVQQASSLGSPSSKALGSGPSDRGQELSIARVASKSGNGR